MSKHRNPIEHSLDRFSDRRSFMRAATVSSLGLLGTACAHSNHTYINANTESPKEDAVMRPKAAAKSFSPDTDILVSDTPVIAMLVHPKMVMQDLIGPMTVFNILGAEIHLVWKTLDPVTTDLRISVTPTTTFDNCPKKIDVLFVPGGLGGSIDMMNDPEVLDFLAKAGKNAGYITSVCTGSLVLGAAGLLNGYAATSHWYVADLLPLLGATYVDDRVVHDRNRITGGGVTAGIDFGLTLAALMKNEDRAKFIQLLIEYEPVPPFNSGIPATADPKLTKKVRAIRKPATDKAREAAERIGVNFS